MVKEFMFINSCFGKNKKRGNNSDKIIEHSVLVGLLIKNMKINI